MSTLVEESVQPSLEADWDTFCAIEDEIGQAEAQGLEPRWRCGRMLLRYEKRERSKNSPLAKAVKTLADELSVEERELYYRRSFAERYPELLNAVQQFRYWSDARKALRVHVGQATGENEWYTPSEYIEAAWRVMGGIDLDPASSEMANGVVGAARFFTEEENGLAQHWEGRVWMNPPYARPLIDSFCAKLAESYAEGDVTEACVLVNNGTETGWFHALAEVASAICFPRHRVKFWHPEREATTPLQGQAVVYLGGNLEAFRAEFLNFGFTVAL